MIFNGISVNGRQVWEIKHCNIPKKIKLAIQIDLPVDVSKLMLISVNISRNQHRQNVYFIKL